jgi:outer membrane protein, multidrug efflux system
MRRLHTTTLTWPRGLPLWVSRSGRCSLYCGTLCSLLWLSACATAPDPSPSPALPSAAEFVNAKAGAAEPVERFWQAFNDADLNDLVASALKANTDLRIAAARLAEAKALAQGTDGLGRPNLNAVAGAGRARTGNGSGSTVTGNQFSGGLESNWELDLFGRIGFEKQSAAANVLAQAALQRAAQVSVAAEVARAYFELRGQQEQLRVASSSLNTQQSALKLVDARLQVGRGTALDTERAQALVQNTAAAVPALQGALARSRLRLAVLTGQTPQAAAQLLTETKTLPGLPATALSQIGSPDTLLRRRPDIAAAEQQLRAAQAQTGAAQKAVFPTLKLSGALGLNAGRIGDLGQPSAFVFNLGASLFWALLDNGQRQSQVNAASARSEAALASFDKTVLLALEETESALATHSRAQQQTELLFNASQSAKRAADIARARFGAGVSDFLAVLDAERESLAAQDRLAQAQTAAAISLVAVYRALAGGWTGP